MSARKQARLAALRRDAALIAKLEMQIAHIRRRRDKTGALLVTADGATWRETAEAGGFENPYIKELLRKHSLASAGSTERKA